MKDKKMYSTRLRAVGLKKTKVLLIAMLASCSPLFSQVLPYQNPCLSAEERATDLLSRLTLDEKVKLMRDSSPAIERLGIKPYEWWNEALHGVARAGLATVFPQTIGMAASFDNELLYNVFDAVSDEARVKHRIALSKGKLRRYDGLTVWTPNINIFRDPRWGRGQETYGEDPYLTSIMGKSVVEGLQGPKDAKYNKLHACAKHFAVHSGPEWNRHSFDAKDIAVRDLYETYLPAFKTLVQQAGVKEVMCAYNRFENEPCCGSNRLLTQILRNEWEYKNIVVSDCGAISDFWIKNNHHVYSDREHASAKAVISGTDLECGGDFASLTKAAKAGLIKEQDINISVHRLLKARIELGEMDDERKVWSEIPDSALNSNSHKQLALKMARESMTLLQNRANILPLQKNKKIALIGPNANDSIMQWANYNGFPSHTVTLLEGLKKYVKSTNLVYIPGCDYAGNNLFTSKFNQCYDSKGKGFHAIYWNNFESKGNFDAEQQYTVPVNLATFGGTVFTSGVNLDNFSAEYKSTFHAIKDEKIQIRIRLQGNLEIFVNNQQVANITKHYNTTTTIYTIDAKKGESYDISLKYRHKRGDATLSFDLCSEHDVDFNGIIKDLKGISTVVFAGGISPRLEGEEMPVTIPGFRGGDRTDIELPAIQRELVKKLKEAGKKIVFVNFSGSAIGLCPESENCEAILQAWYPGQAGGQAVADILYGEYNPAGRLPITFYKSVKQLPDYEDYSMNGRTYRYMKDTPLFSFGYGLSYSKFVYGKATLSKNELSKGETLTITVPVTNKGKVKGDEVVQIYLKNPADVNGPIKALRAFKRVNIPAGKSENVKIELPYDNFNWFDEKSNSIHPFDGNYEILYGSSSREQDLKKLNIQIRN